MLKELGLHASFTQPEHAHLTLAFFENISEQTANTVVAKLRETLGTKPLSILVSLGKLGAFPNQKNPNVLWLEIIDRNGDLIRLKHVIDTTLESLNLPVEKRAFHAHLTVARIKVKHAVTLPDSIFKHEFNFARLPAADLSQLTFFKSVLTPKGSIYSIFDTIALS